MPDGSLVIADVEGDLDLDIVMAGPFVLRNSGDATFEPGPLQQTRLGGAAMVGDDLDQDGRPDLSDGDVDLVTSIPAAEAVFVFRNGGDGLFQLWSSIDGDGTYVPVLVADFDEDGDQDLAVSGHEPHSVTFFANDGTGYFVVRYNLGIGTQCASERRHCICEMRLGRPFWKKGGLEPLRLRAVGLLGNVT